jgi:type III pantothenate kinase
LGESVPFPDLNVCGDSITHTGIPTMPRSLIAIDVGNSRIKFGLIERSDAAEPGPPRCSRSLAVRIEEPIPWEEILAWALPGKNPIVTSLVAGANPEGVKKVFESWPAKQWPLPVRVDDPSRFPLDIQVAEPKKAGIDRLLNAVAANVVRPEGGPAIIVDTGTATTVDYLDSTGAFRGGAILPGFEMSARALNHYTALLPYVSVEELAADTVDPLGGDTHAALASGLFWGQLGAIQALIGQFSRREKQPAFVMLTGGGASLLRPQLPEARFEPHLALQGLALVTDRFVDDSDAVPS